MNSLDKVTKSIHRVRERAHQDIDHRSRLAALRRFSHLLRGELGVLARIGPAGWGRVK